MLYLGLAIIVTLLQIYIEYSNTYATVLFEVDATIQAFEPGVSDAIWNFHKPLLNSIAQGMVSGGTITRVDINDVYKRLNIINFWRFILCCTDLLSFCVPLDDPHSPRANGSTADSVLVFQRSPTFLY